MFIIFFFFQAEDGIRDVAVTGVQTCALPISTNKPTGYEANIGVISSRTRWRSSGASNSSMAGSVFTSGIGRPAPSSERVRNRSVSASGDRKSTRLNSSHGYISYAVFCLKKKKKHREARSGQTDMHRRTV